MSKIGSINKERVATGAEELLLQEHLGDLGPHLNDRCPDKAAKGE